MNFIGGNNYLSDPDSDAELASMTGGDDSSVYSDSEKGSESVYSGGMELSDYELDSQCDGDTDAAILQMGGYQSDDNVVVPTVAEQKGGANSKPIPHDVQVAVAVSSEPQEKEEKEEQAESKVDDTNASSNAAASSKAATTAASSKPVDDKQNQEPSTPLTEEELNNKLNFDTLLGTLLSYEGLDKKIKIDDLFNLCKTEKNEVGGGKSPKIPEEDINNFIETKMNEHINNSNDIRDNGNSEITLIKTTDELFRLIVKCKTLSFLLMSGFSIDTNKTITVEYKKEDNKYELNPPLKYE